MPVIGIAGSVGKGMCYTRSCDLEALRRSVFPQYTSELQDQCNRMVRDMLGPECGIKPMPEIVPSFSTNLWMDSIRKLLSKNKKEQQMNAEMVKACSNDKRQAWCALPSEVREAMKGKPIQVLDVDGTFKDYTWALLTGLTGGAIGKVPQSVIVRLAPTVKADPEYDIRNASMDVHNGQKFWGCVMPGPRPSPLSPAPAFFFPMHEVASMANFAGIRYENDPAWHSCVRCDMGAPMQVRFLKP